MKKLTLKRSKYLAMRARYQAKRHTKEQKQYRRRRKVIALWKSQKMRKQIKKPYKSLKAPENFSLITNTEEVLEYFNDAQAHLKIGENIILDIADVETLTPPTLGLMVASVNSPKFFRESCVKGGPPKKPELFKHFTESGFYKFVRSKGKFADGTDGMLHREGYKRVESTLAKNALIFGVKHVFGKEKPFDSLFEILVEMMSNTHNHADLISAGSCSWWLYVYNDPKQKVSCYSFLDLGAGIFKSAAVTGYKKFIKGGKFYPNSKVAEDLLAGKIKSRAIIDTDIRGKGIPQIVESAQDKNFKEFYIISNDVKIDLKTMEITELQNGVDGTLFYWEIHDL